MPHSPAGKDAMPFPTKLLPRNHMNALLSTLRIFYGEDDNFKKVHVPLQLIVEFWNELCGLTRTTSLLTLNALAKNGEVELTRYDDKGCPEYWQENDDVVDELASIACVDRGPFSIIPRLVRVKKERRGSESRSSDSGGDMGDDDDLLLSGAGADLSGAFGLDGDGQAPRIVNTASAELRKVKEMLDRLQATVIAAGEESGDKFLFTFEVGVFGGGDAVPSGRGLDASVNSDLDNTQGGDVSTLTATVAPPPPSTAQQSRNKQPAAREEVNPLPADMVAKVDALNLGGVFVVLNSRQFEECEAAALYGSSIRTTIEFGNVGSSASGDAAESPILGYRAQLIFASALTPEFLHHKAVLAYRRMLRGTQEDWALGPQDNYFYQHIEDHIREGKYPQFEATLSWRIALLMNTNTLLFSEAYGNKDDFRNLAEDLMLRSAEVSTKSWGEGASHHHFDSAAVIGGGKPQPLNGSEFAAFAIGMETPTQQSPTSRNNAAFSPGAAAAATTPADDPIAFFSKRCALVQMAAAKAERSLLHANKKGAQDRGASMAVRMSRMANTPGSVGGAGNVSPPDGVAIPYGSSTPGAGKKSVTSRSSSSNGGVIDGLPVGLAPAPAAVHISAEPFQKMLDAALSSMNNFESCVELYLNQGTEAEVALLVLRTCIVDLETARRALLAGVQKSLATEERLHAAVQLLLDTADCVPLAASPPTGEWITADMLQFLSRVDCYRAADDSQGVTSQTSSMTSSGYVGASRLASLRLEAENVRDIMHRGHAVFFPGCTSYYTLLAVFETIPRPSTNSLAEYLHWLRVALSVSQTFLGTPLKSFEGFPDPVEETKRSGKGQRLLDLMFRLSHKDRSASVRWCASFVLHNARYNELTPMVVEDMVYSYWSCGDSKTLRHGVPTNGKEPEADFAQQLAHEIDLLPLCDITEPNYLNSLMKATRSEWIVLPPRLKESIRRRFVLLPWDCTLK